MDSSVCLPSALSVYITRITSLLSKLIGREKPGQSNAVPTATMQDGETTQSPMQTTLVRVVRKTKTQDGTFGEITVNGEFVGYSVENSSRIIPEGLYSAVLDLSPRLGYKCPHLSVPDRDVAAGGDAGIRIHIANLPTQLEGCIAVGDQIDGDAVDNSRQVFETMMRMLPESFKVLIYDIH